MNIKDANIIGNQLENTSTIITTPSYMGGKLEPKKSYKSLLISRNLCYENLYFNDFLQEEENEEESFEDNFNLNESYFEIKDGILIPKDSGKEMKAYIKAFNEFFIRKNEKIDLDDDSYLNKKRYFNENIVSPSERKSDIIIHDENKRSTVDYFVKAFLSDYLNNYLFNEGNKRLEKWKKENNYDYKIYKCNYLENIGSSNESTLDQFLVKSFKEMFSIYDATKKEGTGNAKNNAKLFEIIEEDNKDPKQLKLLEDFKIFCESINGVLLIGYYGSKEFVAFKNKKRKNGKTIQDYDYEFSHALKRKRPSLLIPYGFIDYAKSQPYCHNKRKKIKMNLIEK